VTAANYESGPIQEAVRRIGRKVGETILLGTATDIYVEIVDILRAKQPLQYYTKVGTRVLLVHSGVGWPLLSGVADVAPKPWPVLFRQWQARGGSLQISKARVQQGETIAVGSGSLSLNANGRLQGQLRVTVAAIEPFLAAIGAQQMVQASPNMDKLVGALDRLAPGLGNVARNQTTSSNLSLGINLLGEQTTLEGKRAVTLPLRIDDGSMFLGPIKIGTAPALF